MNIKRATWSVLEQATRSSGYAAVNLFTSPYYRFFRQNTLLPILSIARQIRSRKPNGEISAKLSNWRDLKLHELYYVQVAATLLSAAVIGCFSWEPRGSEHWLGPATWYCSLVLSLFAILLSASQTFIFTTIKQSAPHELRTRREIAMVCRVEEKTTAMPPAPDGSGTAADDRERGGSVPALPELELEVEVGVRWNMVFTWQAPIMLLSYSIIAFLAGLTAYVCAPLYGDEEENGGGRQAAVFYLVGLGLGGSCFVWCSYWAYKFVDPEDL